MLSGSNFYFTANNGTNGVELFKNGTLIDINSGSGSSNPTGLTRLGGVSGAIAFAATNGTAGVELWRSDNSGTSMVSNINPGSASSNPSNITPFNTGSGKGVMFTATTAANGTELWTYSISSTFGDTVSMVSDIVSGTGSSSPTIFRNSTGDFSGFYSATNAANGTELWFVTINGQGNGTPIMVDIVSGTGSSSPLAGIEGWGNSSLITGGADYYFSATTTAGGRELWMVTNNGGSLTAVRVMDIFPGTTGSTPTSFGLGMSNTGIYTGSPRYLYFAATGSTAAGNELWIMDMDTAPTGANQSYTCLLYTSPSPRD